LGRLDPTDRAMLARCGRACRDVVRSSSLERAGAFMVVLRARGRSVLVVAVPLRVADFVGTVRRLAWARENGCPWNEYVCSHAAAGGRLDLLQWARAGDCPWDARTCACAARGGYLAVLAYARAHGCAWDVDTCAWAAEGGHLEVLLWAREHGCRWDYMTCALAAGDGARQFFLATS
jgi:hypothetical protein